MERKARKKLEEAKQAADFEDIENTTRELEQICMDQLYVAYFPNDTKYLSIFGPGGERVKDMNKKIAHQREQIKRNILIKVKNGDIGRLKSWVNIDVLRAKNFDLSFAKEQGQLFTKDEDELKNDARFNSNEVNTKNETIKKRKAKDNGLTATPKREKTNIPKNAQESDSSDSDSDDTSSDDSSSEEDTKVDKMSSAKILSTKSISEVKNNDANSDSSSESSSSSSSSSSDSDSDSDSDSSSSSSDESDGENSVADQQQKDHSQNTRLQMKKEEDEESEDDFLVDDDGKADISKIFAKASREVQIYGDMQRKGDKSMGWQTQKQRPGEWKGEKYQKKYI